MGVIMSIWTHCALLTALLFVSGCSQLASRIADKVYPSLDKPWSPENAPTATSFPPSADIRAVLGGRGEGLGCSISGAIEALFFDHDPQREPPVPLQFRQACVFHDFCYRHGHATYGYTKEDCDVMLQEHAYRLCRQIHQSELAQEECQKRARLVLLGVNLGGGSSFQHGHRSTFFEFDPFPARANNYVVARVTRQPPISRPQDAAADGVVWAILFKHGWMTFQRFDGNEWGRQPSATPFLRGKTPVPPFVVRDIGGDRFLWLARPSLANTGVFAYAIDATTPEAITRILPKHMGEPGTENTKCKNADADHDVDSGYSRYEYDCSTSISKPLTIDCDGRAQPLIATFGFYSWTKYFPKATGDPLSLLCNGSKLSLTLASTGTGLKGHGYRFASNEFIVGRFGTSPTGWDLIALGRGHYGDDAKTKSAPDWKENVSVILRPLGVAAETQRIELRLTEADEPHAPLRPDGEAKDHLIALANPCFPGTRCNIEVREWRLRNRWEFSHESLDLPVEWLRQPAQIVSGHGTSHGDWLFLSRVVSTRDFSLEDPWFVPDSSKLEYRLLRRAAGGWLQRASVCVRVDLAKQILAHEGPGLIDRYLLKDYSDWLLGKGKTTAGAAATPAQLCALADAAAIQADFRKGEAAIGPRSRDQLSWLGIKACVALRRDLAAGWHRSQVIPGYLFQPDEAKSKTERDERLPDAAFVFNGFSRHSVVIQQGKPLQAAWAERCAAD